MLSETQSSPDLASIVEEAARAEPVAEDIRRLASTIPAERARAAFDHALASRDVEVATILALVLLEHGQPAPAEAIERIFPDALDDRAARILLASHPESLAIIERMLSRRQLDRFQLASAAALYVRLHPSPPWPSSLMETLRTLARARPGWLGETFARDTALRIGDQHLDELYKIDREKERPGDAPFPELEDKTGIDALLPARTNILASGFTARRATPKVGRNDPCFCGSGKKYKKCCAAKEKNEAWSPVAGITMREYRRRLHEFIDAPAMLKEHPADLARLPIADLTTEQLDACFQVFVDCERMDDAERALAELGKRDLGEKLHIDDLRAELVTFAHDWGHNALVERHLALFTVPEKIPAQVVLGRELRSPSEKALGILEEHCRTHVVEGKPPPMDLAYELLEPYPALGIIIARGCLDTDHPQESSTLLHEIEWARDRLGAPPDDPYWDVWDLLTAERRLAKAADEEKEALRSELERMRAEATEARAEAQVLVRELGKHRGQLSELETRTALAETKKAPTASDKALAAEDAEAARRLRSKIRELEERIREGQRERAELRRHAEELARQAPSADEEEEEKVEEEEGEEVLPRGLRVPVWSTKAVASLEKLPKQIASAAIAAAGALGSGRPEAWRHAKVLEGMHGLCSARLGIHHRLLFRMDEEAVLDVEEVVTREDLDRALAARR